MKARTKFTRMFKTLPESAKRLLVYDYSITPRSLNVIMAEVKNNTELGKAILKDLGYEDD